MELSPPPSKRAVSIFLYKLLYNVLKRMENQVSDLYFLSYGPFVHNLTDQKCQQKKCQKLLNVLKTDF